MESDTAMDQAAKPRAVIERALDALGRIDVEAFLSTLGDDVTWEAMGADYLPNGTRYEGKAAILQDLLPDAMGVYDMSTFKVHPRGVYADGDMVTVEWTVTAKTPRGRSYENPYCMVFTVRDGQIRSVREYTDTAYAKRVLID